MLKVTFKALFPNDTWIENCWVFAHRTTRSSKHWNAFRRPITVPLAADNCHPIIAMNIDVGIVLSVKHSGLSLSPWLEQNSKTHIISCQNVICFSGHVKINICSIMSQVTDANVVLTGVSCFGSAPGQISVCTSWMESNRALNLLPQIMSDPILLEPRLYPD